LRSVCEESFVSAAEAAPAGSVAVEAGVAVVVVHPHHLRLPHHQRRQPGCCASVGAETARPCDAAATTAVAEGEWTLAAGRCSAKSGTPVAADIEVFLAAAASVPAYFAAAAVVVVAVVGIAFLDAVAEVECPAAACRVVVVVTRPCGVAACSEPSWWGSAFPAATGTALELACFAAC